ncbi:MAG: nuclear transport factor 2 family protein [Armatimonadota bacterium]|nr:nuclear transport factor 2 family protein [Armatimonadota bacterium]MDR7400788.1 nuclear transport factor 2 family protein [Armatimonadota bacterium]MDR7403875.1 nuclear transport factor 2 family protein [Armatimonadota bacterium]MDR7436618.1 nuclear transport factor 2 family protein [Armatimonadota bacterium]MDR7472963.1 nuclear transport factor 2 family protein [Armatimonadota bacterium]
MASRTDLTRLLEVHRRAVNARDLEALMALYAEDAVLEFPASPRVEGKAQIRRAYQSFFDNWEETSAYRVVVIQGNTAAVEGTVTGRHKTLHLRIPGRIPTAARTYRHDFAMFIDVQDGKIIRQRVYFDARELVRQLLGQD